jgi:dipeptidyl aminopeptidase/acylaminoacyl peptidase
MALSRRRALGALIVLLAGQACKPSGSESTAASESAKNSRIDFSAVSNAARHPITLQEIVEMREPAHPKRSPDGKSVAFTVRQAFKDCDCYRTALYVAELGGGAPRKLLEESGISEIEWTPDGNAIAYLSTRSGSVQLWTMSAKGGIPRPLFSHRASEDQTIMRRGYNPADTSAVGVFRYAWSADGKRVAFTAPATSDRAALERGKKTGLLYDDTWMHSGDVRSGRWERLPTELWVYDVESKKERKLWQTAGELGDFAWSPDGTRIAVAYAAPPIQKETMIYFNQDLGLVSVSDGKFVDVANGEAVETDPVWSRDGKRLAFTSGLGYQKSTIEVLDVETGNRSSYGRGQVGTRQNDLWWREDGSALIYAGDGGPGKRRERTGIYVLALDGSGPTRVTSFDDHLDECDGVSNGKIACVHESSNISPEIALVSLDGKIDRVTKVNPELDKMTLSRVEERRWPNRYGDSTWGFLLKPTDYVAGTRYPLLLVVYGYNGKFVTQAEWESSFPAQVFPQHGFVVMMVNYPRYDDWMGNDFARGSVAEAYSPLASLEAIVRQLSDEGVIDPARVGMMGTSYGGFWTGFTITHSDLVKAATMHDGGGMYEPANYLMGGSKNGRANDERVLGGPPWGPTFANWQKFSISLNASKVRAPVLMEFNDNEAPGILGFHSALRRNGKAVELYVYPNDGHIFVQPAHRLASMERNIDWFNFWLRGKESSDTTRRGEYARWRAMRDSISKASSVLP